MPACVTGICRPATVIRPSRWSGLGLPSTVKVMSALLVPLAADVSVIQVLVVPTAQAHPDTVLKLIDPLFGPDP